jgi:hypothetical protein
LATSKKKKTSKKASKKKAEIVRGPEYDRERVASGHEVAAASANPAASLAGVIEEISTNVDGVTLSIIDGARAHLAVGDSATGPLTQADLSALRHALEQAIQQTY